MFEHNFNTSIRPKSVIFPHSYKTRVWSLENLLTLNMNIISASVTFDGNLSSVTFDVSNHLNQHEFCVLTIARNILKSMLIVVSHKVDSFWRTTSFAVYNSLHVIMRYILSFREIILKIIRINPHSLRNVLTSDCEVLSRICSTSFNVARPREQITMPVQKKINLINDIYLFGGCMYKSCY